jgi:plastocyanin
MVKKSLILAMGLMLVAASAWGYEAGPVNNGGTIKGMVTVAGPIPQDETIDVTRDQGRCGETLPRQKYVISSDGGIKNVVVYIAQIEKGKPIPEDKIVIDNKKCAFHPHVQVAVKGQTMTVKNDDPMLHNTHMYIDKKTIFNAALPFQGVEINRPLNKTGLVDIECDVHSWMQGYIYVSDNPYITVTDEEGNFSIGDVPPGTYDLQFWHEAFGTQQKKVTVEANGTITVEAEYKQ